MTPLGRANLENRWKSFSERDGRKLIARITPKITLKEKEELIKLIVEEMKTNTEVDYTFQIMWDFVSDKISELVQVSLLRN